MAEERDDTISVDDKGTVAVALLKEDSVASLVEREKEEEGLGL